jgi:hypothetical protein
MGGRPRQGTPKDQRVAENRSGPQAKASGPKAERTNGPTAAHEQGRDQQGRFA